MKTKKVTLYSQSRDIEEMDKGLRNLDSHINVSELQRKLFGRYEENPVLYDAIRGRQTVEESVEELGRINKGIRKILPRRKNRAHNERIKQLGELVTEPDHLSSDGIFVPDNLITACIEAAPVFFGIAYITSSYIYSPNPALNTEKYHQTMYDLQVTIPFIASALYAPFFGLLINNSRFERKLPIEEAKYLDKKVMEFYK